MPVFEHVSADTRYPWSYFTHEPLDELAALVQEAVSRGALPPECFEYRRSHNVMNFLLAQLSGTTFIWDDFYVRHTDLMRLCGVNYGLFRGPGGEGVFSNGTRPLNGNDFNYISPRPRRFRADGDANYTLQPGLVRHWSAAFQRICAERSTTKLVDDPLCLITAASINYDHMTGSTGVGHDRVFDTFWGWDGPGPKTLAEFRRGTRWPLDGWKECLLSGMGVITAQDLGRTTKSIIGTHFTAASSSSDNTTAFVHSTIQLMEVCLDCQAGLPTTHGVFDPCQDTASVCGLMWCEECNKIATEYFETIEEAIPDDWSGGPRLNEVPAQPASCKDCQSEGIVHALPHLRPCGNCFVLGRRCVRTSVVALSADNDPTQAKARRTATMPLVDLRLKHAVQIADCTHVHKNDLRQLMNHYTLQEGSIFCLQTMVWALWEQDSWRRRLQAAGLTQRNAAGSDRQSTTAVPQYGRIHSLVREACFVWTTPLPETFRKEDTNTPHMLQDVVGGVFAMGGRQFVVLTKKELYLVQKLTNPMKLVQVVGPSDITSPTAIDASGPMVVIAQERQLFVVSIDNSSYTHLCIGNLKGEALKAECVRQGVSVGGGVTARGLRYELLLRTLGMTVQRRLPVHMDKKLLLAALSVLGGEAVNNPGDTTDLRDKLEALMEITDEEKELDRQANKPGASASLVQVAGLEYPTNPCDISVVWSVGDGHDASLLVFALLAEGAVHVSKVTFPDHKPSVAYTHTLDLPGDNSWTSVCTSAVDQPATGLWLCRANSAALYHLRTSDNSIAAYHLSLPSTGVAVQPVFVSCTCAPGASTPDVVVAFEAPGDFVGVGVAHPATGDLEVLGGTVMLEGSVRNDGPVGCARFGSPLRLSTVGRTVAVTEAGCVRWGASSFAASKYLYLMHGAASNFGAAIQEGGPSFPTCTSMLGLVETYSQLRRHHCKNFDDVLSAYGKCRGGQDLAISATTQRSTCELLVACRRLQCVLGPIGEIRVRSLLQDFTEHLFAAVRSKMPSPTVLEFMQIVCKLWKMELCELVDTGFYPPRYVGNPYQQDRVVRFARPTEHKLEYNDLAPGADWALAPPFVRVSRAEKLALKEQLAAVGRMASAPIRSKTVRSMGGSAQPQLYKRLRDNPVLWSLPHIQKNEPALGCPKFQKTRCRLPPGVAVQGGHIA